MALPIKTPRLSRFGRKSFASESALSALIGEIREHGLPDASSRSSISRDKRKELNEKTQFGDILKTVDAIGHDDAPIPLTVLNPFAFLQLAINRSEKFRAFLWRTFSAFCVHNHLPVFRRDHSRPGARCSSAEKDPNRVLVGD